MLDQLNIEGATLIGHSLGSNVALNYAVTYDNAHISKLVLVAVPPVDNNQAFPPGVLPAILAALSYDCPATVEQSVDNAFLGSTPTPSDATVAANNRMILQTPCDIIGILLSLAQFDVGFLRDECPLVSIPTLIIHGENDAIFPYSFAETMQSLIPGSTLVPFEDSGHVPQVTQSPLFNTTVKAFIES